MTKRECAIVTAFTGTAMLQGEDLRYLYEYLSDKAGRPVMTHELAAVAERYEEEILEDFRRLCKEATDEEI